MKTVILRQLDSMCKSSDNRLLMYIASSHPSTSGGVSTAVVECTTPLIFEEFQYTGHKLLLLFVVKMICPP